MSSRCIVGVPHLSHDPGLVTALNQVWTTDVIDIKLQKGVLYRVAIMDLFSRSVRGWKRTHNRDREFCLDAPKVVMAGGSKPEMVHSVEK